MQLAPTMDTRNEQLGAVLRHVLSCRAQQSSSLNKYQKKKIILFCSCCFRYQFDVINSVALSSIKYRLERHLMNKEMKGRIKMVGKYV